MTENEKLTLALSVLALCASLAAILVGELQQNREIRLSSRDQLATVVGKIIDAHSELSILEVEFGSVDRPTPSDVNKYEALSATLNQKLTSLARQAHELMSVKGVNTFDVDLIAVANALDNAGDSVGAERLYRLAVTKATSKFFRSLNLSLLADFLMRNLNVVEGRSVFQEALRVLVNDTDRHRDANSRIYKAWFIAEMNFSASPSETIEECRTGAIGLVNSIEFPPLRDAKLEDFRNLFHEYEKARRFDNQTGTAVGSLQRQPMTSRNSVDEGGPPPMR